MKKIATKSETLALLEEFELQAKKKFGQNFIIDPNIIQKTVELANVDDSTIVIEIGPGLGALTQGLLEKAQKVLAYDIDPDVIQVLRNRLNNEKLSLVQQDFLQVDLDALLVPYKGKPIKIVSNLPYYITSDLIEKITLSSVGIEQAIVMVQKEVAEKYTSQTSLKDKQPIHYLLDELADVRYLMTVPRTVFHPMPHVDSALLGITYHGRKVDHGFYQFLKQALKSRRKTLYNNMKGCYPQDCLKQTFDACLLDNAVRSEQLSSAQLKKFYKTITTIMNEHNLD